MVRFPVLCLSVLLLASQLAGCSLPRMQVDSGLSAQAPALPVAGREGWLVEQMLAFGEYRAGPVSRGWTKGYDYPFMVRFTGAREKLRFAVRDGAGNEAMVHCAGKLREADLRVFRDYFDVNVHTTDSFACTVALENETVDFYVENLNTQQNTGYRPLGGAARTGSGLIGMRAAWRLDSGQRWPGTQPLGVEFLRDDTVIGAVETVNEGRVWIRPDLGDRDRLLLASLASALLLRSDLEGHNDDL